MKAAKESLVLLPSGGQKVVKAAAKAKAVLGVIITTTEGLVAIPSQNSVMVRMDSVAMMMAGVAGVTMAGAMTGLGMREKMDFPGLADMTE